jgi:sodium/proline symporter
MILSFSFFLLLFVVVGVSSYLFSNRTRKDYYLASHTMPAWLVGLSAVATNNSGYMFIGVIGYTYTTGLASVWLMFGWILGDFLMSTFVHARVRDAAAKTNEDSYAGLLSHWGGVQFKLFQRVAAIVSLIFLMAYAGAQFVAGGIRASIWTDAAQSIVMIISMTLLLVAAISSLGGIQPTIEKMQGVNGFLDWFPRDDSLVLPGLAGAFLFALGWMFAGMSVIGQPHIMVRFMTLKSNIKMSHARLWYYSWFTLFYIMTTCVGMLSRVYLSDIGSFDAELALPTMAMQLFPPVLVGLILAGMFAATMSTADSLVLSCSASLTHDLLPGRIEKTWVLKLTTISITLLSLSWALFNKQSVFNLVIMAWSTLASAFAPVLIVLALNGKPTQKMILTMMFGGIVVALTWRWLGWHAQVYEGMPGILMGLLIFCVGHIINTRRTCTTKIK